MTTRLIVNSFYKKNLMVLFLDPNNPNAEPFPTFDVDLNKEDKDSDIDNPKIRKDPRIDKPEDEDVPEPEKG